MPVQPVRIRPHHLSRRWAVLLGEKRAKLTPEELLSKRKEEVELLVSAYFALIRELEPSILPKSLLGKAFTYTKNQEANLRNYLKDGRLELSTTARNDQSSHLLSEKRTDSLQHACRRDFQCDHLQHR